MNAELKSNLKCFFDHQVEEFGHEPSLLIRGYMKIAMLDVCRTKFGAKFEDVQEALVEWWKEQNEE